MTTTTQTPYLDIRDLTVRYGEGAVGVSDVSMSIGARSITALVGANGAGKTTVLRSIAGFLRADRVRVAGRITLDGQDITGLAPDRVARRGVAIIPEREKVFASLTVGENLRSIPVPRQETKAAGAVQDRMYEIFPILKERHDQVAGLLSGGEKQMLGIARALMLRPALLLADELSLGIAPALIPVLLNALRVIRDDFGATVLLVEQNVRAAVSVADAAFVLENGKVAFHQAQIGPGTDAGSILSAYFGSDDLQGTQP